MDYKGQERRFYKRLTARLSIKYALIGAHESDETIEYKDSISSFK